MHNSDQMEPSDEYLQLRKTALLERLGQAGCAESLGQIRNIATELQKQLRRPDSALLADDLEDRVEFSRAYLMGELQQIIGSQTVGRGRYYVQRLIKGITELRTNSINDINLNRWKEYEHVITDSLWLIDRRDSTGVHTAGYWGNFIPQIPHQMMLRYTKKSDWVLDPFSGAGTTLIEAQRLGRNSLGIELQVEVAEHSRQLISSEPNPHNVVCQVVTDDSRSIDYRSLLDRYHQHAVQLVVLHPPYFDIIRFSDDPRDLSNASSVPDFLAHLGIIVEKVRDVLESGRYLVLVIGDKYAKGEWIPLGFLAMNKVLECGFQLKSIIVKNFDQTTGKRSQKELWRYRALVGGFYVFKHEYIFVFNAPPL